MYFIYFLYFYEVHHVFPQSSYLSWKALGWFSWRWKTPIYSKASFPYLQDKEGPWADIQFSLNTYSFKPEINKLMVTMLCVPTGSWPALQKHWHYISVQKQVAAVIPSLFNVTLSASTCALQLTGVQQQGHKGNVNNHKKPNLTYLPRDE